MTRFPLELEGEGCVHSGATVGWFGAENEGDGRRLLVDFWIGGDPKEEGGGGRLGRGGFDGWDGI